MMYRGSANRQRVTLMMVWVTAFTRNHDSSGAQIPIGINFNVSCHRHYEMQM